MAVQVKIPTPLRKFTHGSEMVEVEGSNIREVLDQLETNYPSIKSKLCDDSGNVRRFINVYANEEDIRFLDKMETAVSDGDEISIIPAIAGGR
jgi:molybdopterin synthase sulfur carrier subunit